MFRSILFTLFAGLFIIIGCSRVDNPTAPPNSKNISLNPDAKLAVMVDTLDSQGNPSGGAGILGLFDGHIDLSSMTGELVPIRSSALDDALEMVDITNFLRLAPCHDCVKIFNIELDPDNHVAVSIGVKHPFPVGDPYKPITGRNRADLHVFNVEGTLIFDDSSGSTEFSGLGENAGPPYLVNADGYSSYLDPSIDEIFPTTATLHPYVLHFDDYSQGNFDPANPMGFQNVTDPPPTGNLVMPMGCDFNIQKYIFAPPSGASFEFTYAVGCTYSISSASKSQRFTPEYQIPQHNKKAASEVHVEITENLLTTGDTNSSCTLAIKVLDINHGVPVGEALNEMQSNSSVSGVYVEVPGVTSGAISGSATPTGGDGRDPANPLTFSLSFKNDLGATEGFYTGVVKIKDAYPAGLNGSPLLNGMDAIKRVDPLANPLTGLYTLDEFATYMVFNVEVREASHAPVASFITDPPGDPNLAFKFLDYRYITFTSTSSDPDDPLTPSGQIVSYEWDFVWDGIPAHFQDDTAGAGTDEEIWEVDRGGIWRSGLRVTDGGTPPLTSDIYSIQFNVDPWSRDFQISVNDGRIPKIAEMGGGSMMCIWAANNVQTQYNIMDGNFTDPDLAWGTPGVVASESPTYLSIYGGYGQNEAWSSGYCQQYHYNGTTWATTAGAGIIAGCRMTQIYANDNGEYGVFDNTIASFGFIIRIHWPDITTYWYSYSTYISLYGYNNRVIGESRILDKDSQDNLYLVYMQDFALDPYQPPQDSRYIECAKMNEHTSPYTHSIIDNGPQDTLDSAVIACDTSDILHVAYLSQPNGGGNFSIIYKSSSNGASTWSSPVTVWTGSQEPEGEYISIDSDSTNNLAITFHVGDNIYLTYSHDSGATWSTPDIVNKSWSAGIADKNQFMVVDSRDWIHVVWSRIASGSYGVITHKVHAPLH